MSEHSKEALSALLDGELPVGELNRAVDELQDDRSLRSTLARYSLVGAVLRGEADATVAPDFAERVSQKLQDEPTVLAPLSTRPAFRWGRTAAGVAIAASVAALALYLVPTELSLTPSGSGGVPAVATVAAPALRRPLGFAAGNGATPGADARSSTGQVASALSRYLAEHNEFASRSGASGFMSYTTFVTYDGR